MKVTFWGVRGSIATSGPEFAEFGGHTTCVEVEHAGQRLVLDAGTGVRALGQKMLREAHALGRPIETSFFFSHVHWDHIQGFPFFMPAFIANTQLALYGEASLESALEQQMRPPTFPVPLSAMPAKKTFHSITDGSVIEVGPFVVTAQSLCHPQGSLGYRVEAGGRVFCFATDVEQIAPDEVDDSLRRLANGADMLAYDAQYTDAEYEGREGTGPSRKGWGHSTYTAATNVARACDAARLLLIHHDPTHSDQMVAKIEREAQSLYAASAAAREGQSFEL